MKRVLCKLLPLLLALLLAAGTAGCSFVRVERAVNALKDAAGFNLQFAGFKYYDGKFADKDASASFWTSDKYDDSRAYLARVTDTRTTYEHYNKNIFASVRCIKK